MNKIFCAFTGLVLTNCAAMDVALMHDACHEQLPQMLNVVQENSNELSKALSKARSVEEAQLFLSQGADPNGVFMTDTAGKEGEFSFLRLVTPFTLSVMRAMSGTEEQRRKKGQLIDLLLEAGGDPVFEADGISAGNMAVAIYRLDRFLKLRPDVVALDRAVAEKLNKGRENLDDIVLPRAVQQEADLLGFRIALQRSNRNHLDHFFREIGPNNPYFRIVASDYKSPKAVNMLRMFFQHGFNPRRLVWLHYRRSKDVEPRWSVCEIISLNIFLARQDVIDSVPGARINLDRAKKMLLLTDGALDATRRHLPFLL